MCCADLVKYKGVICCWCDLVKNNKVSKSNLLPLPTGQISGTYSFES